MRSILFFVLAILWSLPAVHCTVAEIPQSDRPRFPSSLSGFTLVEFYSPNCRHCRKFGKTLLRVVKYINQNSTDYLGMVVEQFNCKGVRYCPDLGVSSLPTLRLYHNDALLGEIRGNSNFKKVMSWIEGLVRDRRQDMTISTMSDDNDDDYKPEAGLDSISATNHTEIIAKASAQQMGDMDIKNLRHNY